MVVVTCLCQYSRYRAARHRSILALAQNGRSTDTPEGSFKARAGSKAVREVGYTRVRAIWIAPRRRPKRLTALHFSVEVKDISLTDYIQIRHAVYLPHTAGRYAKKQFKKAQMPIVERLVDRLVMILPQHKSYRLCAPLVL